MEKLFLVTYFFIGAEMISLRQFLICVRLLLRLFITPYQTNFKMLIKKSVSAFLNHKFLYELSILIQN